MNDYCVKLNIDIPLLNPRVDINKFKQQYHTKGAISDIHPSILRFLYKKGIYVPLIEAFYANPGFVMDIHTDTVPGDFVKLNWAFDGKDSLMHWYKPKDNVPIVQKLNTIGLEYSKFLEHEVELMHSEAVGAPSIVQVGVPHNISNPLEKRLCISLVIMKNNQRITMQNAIRLFSSEILD